jgi:TolA-binding protein
LASEGLELFLKSNPQSPRRPDATFTLGLCWFNQKVYDKAKLSFDQVLKDYSNSNQFLPAKLKRAQCLHRMGLKASAIKAYKEITDGFNGSPEARTAQQELADLGF